MAPSTSPASSSCLLSQRIDSEAAKALARIAEEDQVTQAVSLEHLIFAEAMKRGWLRKDDSSVAFMALLDETATHLSKLQSPGEDVTLEWFRTIKADGRLRKLHETAMRPPSAKITPEKRRQYVHQRLGRFVKEFLGYESGQEVVLARNADELIRSYTKLIAP